MFRVMSYRNFGLASLLAVLAGFTPGPVAAAAEPPRPIRVGIIGMDAHALPWTQIINSPKVAGELAEMRIVAGYPGGSPDLPASMETLHNSVEPCRKLGVELVDSIDQLLTKVDAVLLLSIDGRPHLAQARPVFAARKPVFIDKPIAATLADAITIYRLAKENNVPSSPLPQITGDETAG